MRLSLLDTDILSEFLKQKNPAVLKNAADYLADFQQFAISAMTRYEVMRGLKDSACTKKDFPTPGGPSHSTSFASRMKRQVANS